MSPLQAKISNVLLPDLEGTTIHEKWLNCSNDYPWYPLPWLMMASRSHPESIQKAALWFLDEQRLHWLLHFQNWQEDKWLTQQLDEIRINEDRVAAEEAAMMEDGPEELSSPIGDVVAIEEKDILEAEEQAFGPTLTEDESAEIYEDGQPKELVEESSDFEDENRESLEENENKNEGAFESPAEMITDFAEGNDSEIETETIEREIEVIEAGNPEFIEVAGLINPGAEHIDIEATEALSEEDEATAIALENLAKEMLEHSEASESLLTEAFEKEPAAESVEIIEETEISEPEVFERSVDAEVELTESSSAALEAKTEEPKEHDNVDELVTNEVAFENAESNLEIEHAAETAQTEITEPIQTGNIIDENTSESLDNEPVIEDYEKNQSTVSEEPVFEENIQLPDELRNEFEEIAALMPDQNLEEVTEHVNENPTQDFGSDLPVESWQNTDDNAAIEQIEEELIELPENFHEGYAEPDLSEKPADLPHQPEDIEHLIEAALSYDPLSESDTIVPTASNTQSTENEEFTESSDLGIGDGQFIDSSVEIAQKDNFSAGNAGYAGSEENQEEESEESDENESVIEDVGSEHTVEIGFEENSTEILPEESALTSDNSELEETVEENSFQSAVSDFNHEEEAYAQDETEVPGAPIPVPSEAISNFFKKPDPDSEPGELTFEPYHSVDYFASQGIKSDQQEEPRNKFDHQLRSFTQWLKTMKRVTPTEAEVTGDPEVDAQADASVSEKQVITETMAGIYEKQGKREKAIDTYEKLKLLHPEKSVFFAARIEDLKTRK